MLFTVQQMIDDRPAPMVIGPEQTGLEALSLMIQHDYSQLPVVDAPSKLAGLVTGDSLLRAVNNLGVMPKDLRVKDAVLKPRIASVESDVFELIDALKAASAVLIVDAAQQLVGIVTDYDAMEFFRRRAEDMMLVEDIETSLKDHIRAAFSSNGQPDDQAMAAAIAEVTGSQKERAKQFQKALAYYLNLAGNGTSDATGKTDASLVQEVLTKHYVDKAQDKTLDDLTMSQYVDVLLHKSRQLYIDRAFSGGTVAVRHLFGSVRPIRNALAHFRGGITPQERSQLRYCADWLVRSRVPTHIQRTADSTVGMAVAGETKVATSQRGTANEQAPTADRDAQSPVPVSEPPKIAATEAMRVADFARLTAWLKEQPGERNVVSMAFNEMERVIGGDLPAHARLHRSWWSNDASTFGYPRAWVDAGWRVGADMVEEVATFTRARA